MRAILVRIGVDHSYGKWNAPADPFTRKFVYVPIPEGRSTRFHPGCGRPYAKVFSDVQRFAAMFELDPVAELGWPTELNRRVMHLDPDFKMLTYGDVGDRRGSHIRDMSQGDLIIFYSGLRPIRAMDDPLVYAIVGLFVVDEVIPAASVNAV